MYLKRAAAILFAALISVALVGGIAPQKAAAATASVGGATKTDAPDIKSKGTIKTPVVKTSGNVSVSSRSYVITKGQKMVAKTSTQGKSVKLKPGTYTVKSTVKYRTFWVEETYDTRTDWENAWAVITDTTWDTDNNHGDGQPEKSAVNASDGTFIDYGSCQADEDGIWDLCYDSQGRYLKGSVYNWSGGWYFNATYIGTEVLTYDSVKHYSGYKTISKTQTIKIAKNSGVMTKYEYNKIKKKAKLSKVKSIVGGTGKVTKSSKRNGHTYVTRSFNGHTVSFDNGKVYAKHW